MKKVMILNLKTVVGHDEFMVHPVVLQSFENIILIDCGFIGSMDLLAVELERVGLSVKQLTKVVVTHHDHDHIANLAELKLINPDIEICASALEKPYLEGVNEAFRLQQALEMQPNLPEKQVEWGLGFIEMLKQVKTVSVDCIVSDNDIIDFATIIETPGHLEGHISVYVPELEILITGDALVLEDNQLQLAYPDLAFNLDYAKKSVAKIMTLAIDEIICYHGGVLKGDVKSELKKLLDVE